MARRRSPEDAPEEAKPTQAIARGWSRMASILAAGLVLLFIIGLGLRIDAERRAGLTATLDGEAIAAQRLADVANGVVVEAWGALAGASDLAAARGLLPSEASAVAAAAARASGVEAAVIVGPDGAVIAATARGFDSLAISAARAAGQSPAWAGAAQNASGALAPALTRRAGGYVLVSLLDIRKLLPAPDGARTIILASADDRILLGSPGLDPRQTASASLGLAGPPSPGTAHLFGADAAGTRLAVGFGDTTGGFRVYAAQATGFGGTGFFSTILSFALMLAAPAIASALALFAANHAEARHAETQARRAEDAEERLDRVQRHFKLAVDGARAGVWTWLRDRNEVQVSQRLQRMMSAPATTLATEAFIALAVKEDQAALKNAFAQGSATGALEVSFRIATKAQVQWVELRGVAVESDEPESRPIVVGTALDVTPRREAELRTVAIERRLKEAIESFSGPFALFDQRKRLIIWNGAYVRAFQLTEPVLRRGASYDALMVAASGALRHDVAEGEDRQSREVQLRSGEWLQLVERATVEGGVVLVGVDISAQKAKEEELIAKERRLRKMFDELARSEGREKELKKKYEYEKLRAEEASRAKTNFLANMSHELRTPLNAINGFSEVMAAEIMGPLGAPKYKEYATDILNSGRHLLDMINDILDMAKIEAGKTSLNPRPLDPMVAVDQAVRFVRQRADDKNLQILIEAKNPPEIEADHRAVKQILINLLTNAVKFTEDGAIMVQAQGQNEGLLLRVVDTGRGIPKDALERLARPFEQVENDYTKTSGGTGLGLALTKTLADLHGGTFAIDSEVGRGTVVTIWLPKTPPMALPPAPEQQDGASRAA